MDLVILIAGPRLAGAAEFLTLSHAHIVFSASLVDVLGGPNFPFKRWLYLTGRTECHRYPSRTLYNLSFIRNERKYGHYKVYLEPERIIIAMIVIDKR